MKTLLSPQRTRFSKSACLALLCFCLQSVDFFSQVGATSSQDENRWFQVAIGYRHALVRGPVSNSGNGLLAELRLNVAKLVKSPLPFSFVAGWGFQDRLRTTGLKTEFVRDYQSAVQSPEKNEDLISESFQQIHSNTAQAPLQPGCASGSFHDYQLYGGLALQPLPRLPIQMKASVGTLRSYQLSEEVQTKDVFAFEIRRPYAALELGWLADLQAVHFKKGNYLSFSLWLQMSNLKAMRIYSEKTGREKQVHEFTSASFQQKYKEELRCGFAVCFLFL